jgi:hypothetical protein
MWWKDGESHKKLEDDNEVEKENSYPLDVVE